MTKTVRLGKMPVRMRSEIQYSIIRPESYRESWNFLFQITPVIKSPFIRYGSTSSLSPPKSWIHPEPHDTPAVIEGQFRAPAEVGRRRVKCS